MKPEHLDLALQAATLGIWNWEIATGRVSWAGEHARLFGIPLSEFGGAIQDVLDRMHPDDRDQGIAAYRRTLAEGCDFDNSYRVIWPDGSVHWLHSVGHLYRDPGGDPERILGVTQEITARRHAERRMAALSAVVANSDSIVVVKDLDLRVIATNEAFARAVGKHSPQELVGKTDAEIFNVSPTTEPIRTYMNDERAAQRLSAGEAIVREEPVIAHDGPRYYLTKKYPIFDTEGLLLGTGNISVDITERRNLEQELRTTNMALTEAVSRAESAVKAKSAFLAHMSHEIRTPMNGIIGLSELALRRPLEPATRNYLEQLHQAGLRLLDILNDILDQSKIEAGQLRVEQAPFDTESLFESKRSLFSPIASSKGLTFLTETDPQIPRWLLGDSLRLRQVLSNLLSNAIKFTEQGQVSLRLQCLDCQPDRVRLRWLVSDTGIGMDASTLERLFQPFTQGDDSIARRFGGTGLGLSISHHLVSLMGGELQVESAPGAGSRFFFELTLHAAEAPADPPANSRSEQHLQLNGTRILVAEDQPLNQQIIADMLELFHAEVTLANNGRQALEQCAHSRFDLVLMDIQMPELDGLRAAQQLRANRAWHQPPIIALTAGVTPEERQRIEQAGMNDLLSKPLTLRTLTDTLSRWFPDAVFANPPANPPPNPARRQQPDQTPNGQATQSGPVDLPDFDLEPLTEAVGGKRDLTELLSDFATAVRDDPDALARAIAARDLAGARRIAHRLKGLSGNLGAMTLHQAAMRLESALGEPGGSIQASLAELRDAHRRALEQIDRLVTAAPADPPNTPPALRSDP